ncbi:MAG: hypothetical protein IPP15_05260 [Saprospiraceae bacterium]|uniref:Beta-barrel porin 2 n=1 Tax=Candidatus Opimibacter skivensis TaxID=2982028 RepID=A0A9D7XRX1_9BACT|nr:hypothetical protein [Candidatus Opimibacter skivensis]
MFNLTRVISVLIFVVLSLPSFAQIDFKHFPIDSFKLPTIQWKGLTLGGSLSGSYDYEDEFATTDNDKSSYFSHSPSLSYFGFINRPDRQASYSLSTSPRFYLEHRTGDDFISRRDLTERYFSPDAHVYWSQLNYHQNSFFQVGIEADLDFSKKYTRTERASSTTTTRRTTFSSTLALPIGFGHGRLEPVSDVTMALFLLKDVVDIGIDPQSIHQEDVIAFGELMATVRNQRIFDTRRKRIFELRSLYDFMLAKDWVLPDDPGFFTVLTDNWLYNFGTNRYSGNRWTYLFIPRLSPGINSSSNTGNINSENKNQSYSGSLSVMYEHYKPQSLYRNFRRIHSIQAGVFNNINISNDQKTTYSTLQGEFLNEIGYTWYPNTRTNIYTSLHADYTYMKFLDTKDIGDQDDQHRIDLSLSGGSTYFLSYKTQLKLSAGIHYVHNTGKDITIIGNNFTVLTGSDIISADVNASVSISIF